MRVCVFMFGMRAVVPSCPLHVQQQVDQGRTPGSEPPSPSCGHHSYPPWTLVCLHCSEQSPCPGDSLSHCGLPMDHSDSPCPSLSLLPLGSGQSQENPRSRRRSREGQKEVLAPCPPASCSCPACPACPALPWSWQVPSKSLPQLCTRRPLTSVSPLCCGPRQPSSDRDSFVCSSGAPGQVCVPPINILAPLPPRPTPPGFTLAIKNVLDKPTGTAPAS